MKPSNSPYSNFLYSSKITQTNMLQKMCLDERSAAEDEGQNAQTEH